jgi:hypothetical protein
VSVPLFVCTLAGLSLVRGPLPSPSPSRADDVSVVTVSSLRSPPADGIAQAMSALSTVSDLVFQTTNEGAATRDRAHSRSMWRIRAAYANGAPGLVVFGKFSGP